MKEELDSFEKLIKEEMEKDAALIEKAIEADPEISAMTASDELKESVYSRIEEYQRDKILAQLSEEDKEALLLGRRIREENPKANKTSHGRRFLGKRIVVLAAAIVLALAIGITSVGGPKRFIAVVKQTVGGREMTKVNSNSEEVLDSGERKESKAYQQIKDELGIDPVKILNKPTAMQFEAVEIDSEIPMAQMSYDMNGQKINYIIDALYTDNSWGLDVEDELLDTYEYPLEKTTANVEEYKVGDEGAIRYVVQFDYQEVHYSLIGIMEKEDLEIILKNLYFL